MRSSGVNTLLGKIAKASMAYERGYSITRTVDGPKTKSWPRFLSRSFRACLDLRQFMAAFKSKISIVRHPDLTVAADPEKFPTRT